MSIASIKALEQQIYSGKIDSDKAAILNQIMINDCTIENLQNILTMQYSTITARLSDLMDLGVIKCKSYGHYTLYTYEACTGKQALNRADREEIRFNKWQKKAKDFGRFLLPSDIEWITNIK